MALRRTPLLALLLVAAVAALPSALGTTNAFYVAVGGDALAVCPGATGLDPGRDVGGACYLPVPDNTSYAEITIRDRVTDPTGGYYKFTRPGDTLLGQEDVAGGSFCDEVDATVPADATDLTVYVDNAKGPLDCDGAPATGTLGHVVVVWK